MRVLWRLFVIVLALVPIGVLALAVLAVQRQPLVVVGTDIAPDTIERVKSLLAEHDPRRLRDGEVKTVDVSEQEVQLLADHLLRRIGHGAAQVRIDQGSLLLLATLRLPQFSARYHVNVVLGLHEVGSLPRLSLLRVGRVTVPAWLADPIFERTLDALYAATGVRHAPQVLHAVHLHDQRMALTYRWQEGLTAAIRDRVLSEEDRLRLAAYNARLTELTRQQARQMPLARLIEPVFTLAGERSPGSDAVAENRAALLVLAAYVNGRDLEMLVPEASSWPRPRRIPVTVHGRRDLAQHFLSSAVLAATGGDAFSQAIGLFKEIEDARGGSGFSFPDLLADEAGTRFGNMATASAGSAVELQRRAAMADESALVPDPQGLEERMSETEFGQRYGGVGGAGYERELREIARRIDDSPLYR